MTQNEWRNFGQVFCKRQILLFHDYINNAYFVTQNESSSFSDGEFDRSLTHFEWQKLR